MESKQSLHIFESVECYQYERVMGVFYEKLDRSVKDAQQVRVIVWKWKIWIQSELRNYTCNIVLISYFQYETKYQVECSDFEKYWQSYNFLGQFKVGYHQTWWKCIPSVTLSFILTHYFDKLLIKKTLRNMWYSFTTPGSFSDENIWRRNENTSEVKNNYYCSSFSQQNIVPLKPCILYINFQVFIQRCVYWLSGTCFVKV